MGVASGSFQMNPTLAMALLGTPERIILAEMTNFIFNIKKCQHVDNPGNPACDVVFNPKYQNLYANKDSATDSFVIYCKKLLNEAKIDVEEIAINGIPDVPIWGSEPVTVDFTLSEFDKSSTSTF